MNSDSDFTSAEMSAALAARGVRLGADGVRRWFQRGAPRTEVNAFLQFYRERRTTNRPMQRCDGTPAFELLKILKAMPHPDELGEVVDRLLTELESEAESALAKELQGPAKDAFFFAVALKRVAEALTISAVFGTGVAIQLGLETRAEVKKAFSRVVKRLDWPALWRDLRLLEKSQGKTDEPTHT